MHIYECGESTGTGKDYVIIILIAKYLKLYYNFSASNKSRCSYCQHVFRDTAVFHSTGPIPLEKTCVLEREGEKRECVCV